MKTIIKYFILFIALVATSLSLAACGGNEDTIAIVKFGTHTSLDEIENSIMEEIKEKLPDIKIKNYDCNFSPDIITANISSIKSNKNVKVCVLFVLQRRSLLLRRCWFSCWMTRD